MGLTEGDAPMDVDSEVNCKPDVVAETHAKGSLEEALYGDPSLLTAPIKDVKDKWKLLPAFLKVRLQVAGWPWCSSEYPSIRNSGTTADNWMLYRKVGNLTNKSGLAHRVATHRRGVCACVRRIGVQATCAPGLYRVASQKDGGLQATSQV